MHFNTIIIIGMLAIADLAAALPASVSTAKQTRAQDVAIVERHEDGSSSPSPDVLDARNLEDNSVDGIASRFTKFRKGDEVVVKYGRYKGVHGIILSVVSAASIAVSLYNGEYVLIKAGSLALA